MVENTVLISLHPKHAQKILNGEKKLEFRRVWAQKPVSRIVIYATAPIQRIVATARIKTVHSGSATKLWSLCQTRGGGLTRRELYAYFKGKKCGYAIEIEDVTPIQPALEPRLVIENFTPPQSLQYLHSSVATMIAEKAKQRKGTVFFVGGIHGVGKTTLCERIASETGLVHKSAGQLIKEAGPGALSTTTKAVKDAEQNQRLLIDQVQKIVSSGVNLLLDGHFTLLKPDGSIETIPQGIFRDLGVGGIVLLSDDVDQIARRVKDRDGNEVSLSRVRQHQEKEMIAAEMTANFLKVDFHQSAGSSEVQTEGVLAAIKTWKTDTALSEVIS